MPVALVLQDGAEMLKNRASLPWIFRNEIAAVFVGGSTVWKTSEEAENLTRQAKDCGLLVHVGRVNTKQRIRRIARWGTVDTFDGSGFSRWGQLRIPMAVRWIDSALRESRKPNLFS
jgi:EAL domain-containing protein (putative c-di-GMP-specific phosphodiesterase class I)